MDADISQLTYKDISCWKFHGAALLRPNDRIKSIVCGMDASSIQYESLEVQ